MVGSLKRTRAILDVVGKACDFPNFHAKIDSATAKNMGDKFTKITIFYNLWSFGKYLIHVNNHVIFNQLCGKFMDSFIKIVSKKFMALCVYL